MWTTRTPAAHTSPDGKKRRDLYLDLTQRRALVKAVKGAERHVSEGVARQARVVANW